MESSLRLVFFIVYTKEPVTLETIFIIGAFQSFFFSVFLLSKKQNHFANIFMGLWLFSLGLFFLDAWIAAGKIYESYPHLSGIFSGIPLVNGPFFWLYVIFMLNPHRRWDWRLLLHFLPFVLYYLHASLTFFQLNSEEKILLMDNLASGIIPVELMVWGVIKSLHGLIYMGFVLWKLNGHEEAMKQRFSNPDKIRVWWLRILGVSLLVIYVFALVNFFLVVFVKVNLEFVLGLLSAVLILCGGYLAMRQKQLFETEVIPDISPLVQTYDVSELDPDKQRLISYIEKDKPYLNPDLSLQDIAGALELHPKQVSRILNEAIGQNFFTFINQYRVNEVIAQMQSSENDHLTLLGIGLQSGFNSKTTFNTVFKKLVGKTPSEFKKSITY